MSEQQQRIDCCAVFLGDVLQDTYTLERHAIEHAKALGYTARWMRLVEIREGEPHPDEAAATIAALTERAEKAEAERDEALADHAAGIELAKNMNDIVADERARFERKAFLAVLPYYLGRYGLKDHGESIARHAATEHAKEDADHYFGAKEAK